MADHKTVRNRSGLAVILALLLVFAAGCKPPDETASPGSGAAPGSVGTTVVAVASPTGGGTQNICGTPPCVRFVPRSDTKTLSDTIAGHPVLSTVALHAAVMVLCGGILCLLAEGVGLDYVAHAAKDAADKHACLKVDILSDDAKWKLVSLSTSNQSPYCTG